MQSATQCPLSSEVELFYHFETSEFCYRIRRALRQELKNTCATHALEVISQLIICDRLSVPAGMRAFKPHLTLNCLRVNWASMSVLASSHHAFWHVEQVKVTFIQHRAVALLIRTVIQQVQEHS